jgi:hypothetical protein
MRRRAHLLVVAAFACLVGVFFSRAALLQGVFFIGDVSHAYFPRFSFTAAALREGRLPLWNPYLALGQPHLGDPAATALYPPAVLAFLSLPGFAAYNYVVLGHVLLAALGTFTLARRIGLSASAALLGGVAYGFGGWMLTHTEHINVLVGASWLPLLLWLVERAIAGARASTILAGSVLVATYLLGAHVQIALYAAATAALYAVLRLGPRLRAGGGGKAVGTVLAILAATAMLGAGLAAIQLIPTAEAVLSSNRGGGLGGDIAFAYSFPPEQLLGLVVPYLFEKGLDGRAPWGRSSFREMTLYVGIVPLVLAVFGVARCRRDGRSVALLTLLALSLLMALGSYSPASWVFGAFPVFNLVRFPSRILFVSALCLALLAGLGLDQLRERADRAWARRLQWSGAAGILVLVALNLLLSARTWALASAARLVTIFHPRSEDPPEWYVDTARFIFGLDGPPGAGLFIPLLAATGLVAAFRADWIRGPRLLALVVGLSAADLFAFSRTLTRNATTAPSFYDEPSPTVRILQSDPQSPFRSYYFGASGSNAHFRRIIRPSRLGRLRNYEMLLMEGLRGSVGSLHAIATLEGTGLTAPRQFEILRALGGLQPFDITHRDLERADLNVGLLALLNGRYVTTLTPLRDPRLTLVRQGEIVLLYRNDTALPRVYIAPRFEVVRDPHAIVERLTHPEFDAAGPALLEEDPGFLPSRSATGEAVIRHYAAEQVEIEARLVGAALLVLSDAFDPDWQAEVDGVPRRILAVNAVLRGVPLSTGRHTVRFRYAPRAVARGIAVSSVSALGLLAVALGSRGRVRRWVSGFAPRLTESRPGMG